MRGTVGSGTGFNGRNDQWVSRGSASSGITAPRWIHSEIVRIAAASSRAPLGGIIISGSRLVILRTSSPDAGFPGRTAGSPESPPTSSDCRRSTRRPLSCFSGPWQPRQCLASIGRMSLLKSGAAPRRGTVATRTHRNGSRTFIGVDSNGRYDRRSTRLPPPKT
ncbi:MAG: hypothetical protein Ct9H300mP1_13300 [Planctomycetaceae bacterium]|nr:MAG: hypothetical protein Ct9H300mP1_13300 [Planctomycetaceae bacterium]